MNINTPSLHELQREFLKSIYAFYKEKKYKNLKIHHNNIIITLTKALSSIYPASEKIVGKDFFAGAAEYYIRQYPSTVNSLNDYGQYFAEFIATFTPASNLLYLSELAKLEWGCHEILHAPSAPLSNLKNLTTISARQYAELKFTLSPASRLFNFQYPIYHIWQLCQQQEDSDEMISLEEGGVKLLILSSQFVVKFYVLSAAEFALLNALAANSTISAACTDALALEPAFDVTAALNKYMTHGIIVNYLL